MFGWFQKKMENTQKREAEAFLNMVKGADNDALDLINGCTMFWSVHYLKNNQNVYEMEHWIHQNMMFPMVIGNSIRALQKQGTTSSVPGLMVWLHSARALLYPELRIYGRQIWEELVKATPEAEVFAAELCVGAGEPYSYFDRQRVPIGLESIRR